MGWSQFRLEGIASVVAPLSQTAPETAEKARCDSRFINGGITKVSWSPSDVECLPVARKLDDGIRSHRCAVLREGTRLALAARIYYSN
jgi:hypothetical protein